MVNLRRFLADATQSMPPVSARRLNHEYASETNFDTNMVIILAALLCALVCALGLNSMLRCALRCTRGFGRETPEQAAARLATTGVKKHTLRKIPLSVYGSDFKILATECPICLGEFVTGEKIRVLPKCNHSFHVKCIDTWLVSHSTCPICRRSLLERPTSSRVADENSAAQPPENSSASQSSVTIVVDVAAS